MDFQQKKKVRNQEHNYHIENLRIARNFSKEILLEMKELVRSIVLFGSNTHDTLNKDSDIDIMIVLDNVSVFVSEELREAYRIITSNLCNKHSNKIHLMSVNLSDLWDMARKGDPVLINILRYGMPIFDRDLIEPLQYLLEIGKIRPTREAVFNYVSRAKTLHEETEKHLEISVLDMYYSVVDIVHASLMCKKIMPPSPKDMPSIFKKEFKEKKYEKIVKDIELFYKVAKDIEHKTGEKITGKKYDELRKKSESILIELEKFIKIEISKKDTFEL